MSATTTKPRRGRPKREGKDAATVAALPAALKGRKPVIELEAEEREEPAATKGRERVIISAPKFETAQVTILGTSPLVLHKFSQKVRDSIQATQEAGSQSKKGKARVARDFEEGWQAARHRSTEGWDGIPASAFRNAMISACRVVGFKMTLAKLSLFVVANGYDENGTGLVRITKGEPHQDIRPGRNANGGIDLRARPMWPPGWVAKVTVRWDGDQFSVHDVFNLMARVGAQVGVGEGRADSKMSAGCGWGEFEIIP
jgi:hypothetical protein